MSSFSLARMAKLADALASGASGRKALQVQVLFRAQSRVAFFATLLCIIAKTLSESREAGRVEGSCSGHWKRKCHLFFGWHFLFQGSHDRTEGQVEGPLRRARNPAWFSPQLLLSGGSVRREAPSGVRTGFRAPNAAH